MRALVRRVQPDVTVWYHQHMRLVNLSPGADPALVRDYARRVGLPARTLPHYHGTATSWQNHTFAGTSAFVVELPAGALTAAAARRHAGAVLAVGRRARDRRAGAAPARSSGRGSRSAATARRRCAPTPAATTASTTRG